MGWQWESELMAEKSNGDKFNVGNFGPFRTEADAEDATREILGNTLSEMRETTAFGAYEDAIEDFSLKEESVITEAVLQRFDDDGIDYDSQRSIEHSERR